MHRKPKWLVEVATGPRGPLSLCSPFRWRAPRPGAPASSAPARRTRLVAATGSFGLLDLLQHLVEVVARRVLERRVRNIGLEFLQPQRLADGQHVPVIDVGCRRGADYAAHAHECLVL